MIIENPEIFRFWLSTVLEPLCDADPVALAKYVYALVKKDKPVNDLRTSMVEQLDVFLQEETQSFVALLFKTIENKEYLNVKKDAVKEEKKVEESKPAPLVEEGLVDASAGKEPEKPENKENDNFISSTDEKQNGVQIQSSVVSEGPIAAKPADGENKVPEIKEDKKRENERDDRSRFNRNRNRKENSLTRNQRSRSRSWDRIRRSRSRDRDRGDRAREKDRIRLYRNKSPPRRYDRGFDRRRTYSRSPSPFRYRTLYPTRSKSKSRSPKLSHRGRFRNRSPTLSRSRSPRSRSRSFEGKNCGPNQDNNHGDRDGMPRTGPGNEGECDRFSSKARRCRDYDEKGYCLRGELCLYDHGTDPVVLEDVALSQVLTYGPQRPHDPVPMQPPGVQGPIIHDMVPPMGSIPGMPPPMGMDHCPPMGPPPLMVMQAPPPLVMRPPPNMEYSPNAPGMNSNMNWGRPGFRGMHPRPMHPHQPGMGFNQGQRALINVPVESNSHSFHKQNNVVAENHGHSDRRGGFEPPRQYTNSCLILKKVPSGLNNITHLNNHFAKFGKIVNIQVNYENDPESAMITFSNPAEANAAIKSTEAVLNNRFIKVFWHNSNKDGGKHNNSKDKFGPGGQGGSPAGGKPQEDGSLNKKQGGGDAGAQAEVAMSPEEKKAKTIAAIKKSQEMLEKNKLLRKKTEEKRKEALKLTSDLRKRTQVLLEKQMEQQKALIKKLEIGGLDDKQKKDIMDTVKGLQDSIQKIQQELVETAKSAKKMIPVKKTKEEIQKEILDTELDLISKQQEGGDVSGLQKKISALKLELAKVQPKLVGSRPVARGQHKTVLAKNMSLNRMRTTKVNHIKTVIDHRPTKILVSGYENDEKDLVLTHFRQFGEVGDYIADDSTPSIVLNYKTRQEAETAMAKGKSFQDRLLAVTWYTTATNPQFRRRNSSGSGPTYHIHADRQVLLSGGEENPQAEAPLEPEESEVEFGVESSEDLLLQDDDEDLEDEERSWRR